MTPTPGGLSSPGVRAPGDIAATRQALRETDDVAERRRLEAELQTLQRHVLGDELGRLSGALKLSEERRIAAERTLAAVATDAAAKLLTAEAERDRARAEAEDLHRRLATQPATVVAAAEALTPIDDRIQVVPRGRAFRILVVVALVVGILVAIEGVLTIIWQDPISGLFASVKQSQARHQFTALRKQYAPTPAQRKVLTHGSATHRRHELVLYQRHQAAHLLNDAPDGHALAKISIPKIGATFTVIQGVSTGDLQKGPGHYPGTMLPGLPGTTAIAGHRTTFLAPFRHLNRLRRGSEIIVTMPYGRFRYKVIGIKSVLPADARVVRARHGVQKLVLTACDPPFSAARRLVVTARLARAISV